jgi:alkanesulfonate monooxygenase SsuD/methylene tetrahydromethanopterin reductase-like flavin-dependent oxidoreductase (luciferase family)
MLDGSGRSADRDPRSLGIALIQNAFVANDADAWEISRASVAHQFGTYRAWEGTADTPEDDRLDLRPPDEETMRTWTPAGTPDEVLRAQRPLVEAFGDRELHLIVRLHYPGMDLGPVAEAVDPFGREVLSALKAG